MRGRVVAVLAALLPASLSVAVTSPAGATNACAGAGTLTTGTPLYYPVTVTSAPAFTVRQPRMTTWGFALDPGTGTCVPLKGLTATGVLSGWCGLSSASGATSDGHRFVWQNVGSVLVFTGGLNGVGTLQPNLVGGESCVDGADNFLISLAAVKTSCAVKQKLLTTLGTPGPPFLTPVPGGSIHSDGYHVWHKYCIGVK